MDGRQLIYKLSCEKKDFFFIKNERINKPEKINEPFHGMKQFMDVVQMDDSGSKWVIVNS